MKFLLTCGNKLVELIKVVYLLIKIPTVILGILIRYIDERKFLYVPSEYLYHFFSKSSTDLITIMKGK